MINAAELRDCDPMDPRAQRVVQVRVDQLIGPSDGLALARPGPGGAATRSSPAVARPVAGHDPASPRSKRINWPCLDGTTEYEKRGTS